MNILNAPVEILNDELFQQKKVSVSVLRLDKIHPVVSGNKLFKLHYFLQQAISSAHKTIVTFGGAYSNHLVATAFACQAPGLKSIGIVRGEKPAQLSATLQQCSNYGMQLKFISREAYSKKEEDDFLSALKNEYGECIIIPEGGYHALGAKGAALIYDLIKDNSYTHICTATGTATTLAGLLLNDSGKKIISVPVLKGMNDTEKRINFLLGNNFKTDMLQIFNEYHFGGYAKKTEVLTEFMNCLWQQHQLPTDFVYTAKLFFAVFDKIKSNYFEEHSNILCLHTGGLQGNSSLPAGTLLF
ncbi:1-aminocyclopropane-1-carboxylate deaminase/D-cysteine desulfhydrase [Ferruginibacter sp.]